MNQIKKNKFSSSNDLEKKISGIKVNSPPTIDPNIKDGKQFFLFKFSLLI